MSDAPDDAPDDDRLEELDQQIDAARQQAEDHGSIPDSDPEPTFADPDGDGDEATPNNAPA